VSNKYTVYGNPEFEAYIDQWVQKIAQQAVLAAGANNIAAIILGGGYGRGEGGVVTVPDGTMRPYNDFDFFVITADCGYLTRRRINIALRALGHELTRQVGIDVDFSPVKNRAELPRQQFTMMWQELKSAHLVIYGEANILELLPGFDLNQLPLEELAKLMLNRGTGLIMAAERLRQDKLAAADIDFITRNIWKSIMASGDCFLALQHTFSSSYRRRAELMKNYQESPETADFVTLYQASIDFKLRPELPPAESLPAMLVQAREFFARFYLLVFNRCLGTTSLTFAELQERLFKNPLFPSNATWRAVIKNLLLNILVVDRGKINLKWCSSYPRSRLFVIFPDFFLDSCDKSKYISVVPGLCPGSVCEDCFKKYLFLWNRFN
jgi:hypothetical protein